jgi:chromosome segregation ATPase
MLKKTMTGPALTIFGACVLVAFAGPAAAQGKIVCWKDKAGKVLGCGDKVPPEFQDSATKELDKRGLTRKTTESNEEATRRREQDKELDQQKAEQARLVAEQKRQDAALINTYTSEQEIDAKRDRDLGVVDLQVNQLQVSLKGATERYNEAKGRVDGIEKTKKPVPDNIREDLTRAEAEKRKIEENIVAKQKEKEEVRKRYADYRKRYTELRGAPAPAPAAAKK